MFSGDVKEVRQNKKESCDALMRRETLMVPPKHHHVSQLIVRHYHESVAHSGREQTFSELRRMFWIIGGKVLLKKTIGSCIRCRRMNAKPLEQFMGSLPRARRITLRLLLLALTCLDH